jgi:hypothetical protein
LLYNFEPPQAGETYTWKKQLIPEGAYSAEFLKALEASGINVRQESRVQVLTLKGTAAVATIDPKSGMRRSAEDPGIIDFADGYQAACEATRAWEPSSGVTRLCLRAHSWR